MGENEHDEIVAKFTDAMNRAIAETFGEAGLPSSLSTLTGMKFNGQDGCHILSNLTPCQLPGALAEMLEGATRSHGEHHANEAHSVTEVVPADSVPQGVRDFSEALAEGLGARGIIYAQTVDTEDLACLPEPLPGEDGYGS